MCCTHKVKRPQLQHNAQYTQKVKYYNNVKKITKQITAMRQTSGIIINFNIELIAEESTPVLDLTLKSSSVSSSLHQ